MSDREARVSTVVGADPAVVWTMVSDVTRMGEWSPETTGCRWLDGATGPEVGARFRGSNRKDLWRWTTTCTVTAAEPGRRFAFDVRSAGSPVSSWCYEFAPHPDGCEVVESWTDRRPAWMRLTVGPLMGTADRAAHNRGTMQTTLQRLKAAAESG